MLRQVLAELEKAETPMSVTALSRKLGIEQNMLEMMLEYWVRQGRLQDNKQFISSPEAACSKGGCGSACHGPQNCSFIAKIPRAFTLKEN
ncbi:MAG TPA: FeoC-like transcriptional regulator [Chloroflexia bacterium]|nr:FeoC-like transcriptional regulator [Chloroflexia bacterium]